MTIPKPKLFDAIVVGAGPSGSTVARDLVLHGHSVLLVEKDSYPGENSVCGGITQETYVSDLDLAPAVIERQLSRFHYHIGDSTYALNIPTLSFQRNVFDRFLAENAAKLGAQLLTGTLAHDVSIDGKVVVSLMNKSSAQKYTMESKLIVFADGPHTLANTTLGIGFERRAQDTAIAAIYEIEWPDNPLDAFELFVEPQISSCGYGWVFPKKHILNAGAYCLMSRIGNANIHAFLDYFVREFVPVAKYLVGRPRTRFAAAMIPIAPAKQVYGPRCLVAGDAAGMVEPIWGDGIGFSIAGAHIAAEVAHEALVKDQFSEAFLSSYQRRWEASHEWRMIRRYSTLLRLLLKILPKHNNPFRWIARTALRTYALLDGLNLEKTQRSDLLSG